MFTGLVEELGSISAIEKKEVGALIRISCNVVATDAQIGDSICVNGCCLTAVEVEQGMLAFEAGTETLSRTNLGELSAGSVVNLERSLQPQQRMGGHFVSGHIDAIGTLVNREPEGDWAKYWFQVPHELTRQMASKGSVAVDGISLTLVDVTDSQFSIALIPHTLKVTTLGVRNEGDTVNIETDILAKYVERQMTSREFNSQQPKSI